jgi:hypothetical protein
VVSVVSVVPINIKKASCGNEHHRRERWSIEVVRKEISKGSKNHLKRCH